jgi:hypothetical protein
MSKIYGKDPLGKIYGEAKGNTLVYDKSSGAPMDFAIENLPLIKTNQFEGSTHWTHICPVCMDKYKVNRDNTEIITTVNTSSGSRRENPPCGVQWCRETSTHFYDFIGDKDPFVAAVRRVAHEQRE